MQSSLAAALEESVSLSAKAGTEAAVAQFFDSAAKLKDDPKVGLGSWPNSARAQPKQWNKQMCNRID